MKIKVGPACIFARISGVFLLLAGSSAIGFSQTFTKERDKFVKECRQIFVDESMQLNVQDVFPKVIEGAGLNDNQFAKMVDGANAILKSKEDYELAYFYVAAFVYQTKNKLGSDFFSTWLSLEKSYREKELDDYSEFMDFSYNLFRWKALFKDDNSVWIFKGNLTWNSEKKLKIECSEGTLLGFSAALKGQDSVYVTETSGVFDYESKKFSGRNGTVTWQKVGLNKAETFAELRGYRISMKEVSLKADTVSLTTPYFQQPILGSLVDKALDQLEEGEGAPRFISFDKRLKIKELRESMNYDGGFSLEGSRLVGKGTKENPAKLFYFLNDKPLFEISALSFDIDPGEILARPARLKLLYSNGDSLVHNDGLFQFTESTSTMLWTSSKKGNTVVPFMDYHYQISVNAPCLKWERNTAYPKYSFEMATAQEQKKIQIESFNFYNPVLVKTFSNGGGNPFTQLANFSKKLNTNVLTEGQASSALGTTLDYAKNRLLDLSAQGFLEYNSFEKQVVLLPKLFNYADVASSGKDYDNIMLTCDLTPRKGSAPDQSANGNALDKKELEKMNLLNNRFKKQDFYGFIDISKDQMFLTGVDRVVLSEAQKTSFYPDSTYLILKPKLDMVFNGDLLIGKLQVAMKAAYFSYDRFKVSVKNAQYAALNVNPLNPQDGSDPITVVSNFYNLTADIMIDEPNAKSGRSKTNSVYPKVLVPQKSKVLYNDPSIVRGAYDSSRFYYLLEPFELDSLDNFEERSQRFKGELISGGIFPPIKESLKIMPDYSLGFATVAPPGGWAFYGENSKYENKVVLSGNGLQGSGTINFTTATAISQKLTFLPDSTIGIAKFENKESKSGIQVPSVKSEGAYICFIPKKQALKASSWKGLGLAMFNNQTEMDGTVVLSKTGMRGDGNLLFPDAEIGSHNFHFTHEDIHADTSSFRLKNRFISEGQAPVAMETKDVKCDVSFTTRKGEFNSFGTKRIKFPPNQYYCTMDKFFWYMDQANVDFEKAKKNQTTFEAGADLDESNFFSMHEEQDTLQFRSLFARYDLKLQTLFCNKVEYVRVGDAKIFPDSMKVIIRKNAVMDPLVNATIIAPFVTKFHKFTDATVTVTSRKKYDGFGKYPYYDRDSTLTVLNMKSIKYLNSVTQAEGEVVQKDNFKLSKEFDYYGKIKVMAHSKGLFCEGSTRINHACSNFDRSWLFFKDTIVANNIQIPISENPMNDLGKSLAVGFLWKSSESMDSVKVYPAFLSKMQGRVDEKVFQASGYVQFNPAGQTFQIAPKSRLNGSSELGNMLTLYTESCSLSGIGEVSFGVNLGEVTTRSFGSINYEKEAKKIYADLTTLIQFPMQSNVFQQFSEALKKIEGQKNTEFKSKQHNFAQILPNLLSEEKINDLYKDFEEEKLRKMPDALGQTLILTGLRFELVHFGTKSNDANFASGWVARPRSDAKEIDEEGDQVKAKNRCAIIAIEGRPVLKDVEMNMVVSQAPLGNSGQSLMVKFKTSAEKDYLFNYEMNKKDGKLSINSNDEALKTMISEMKPDKRKSKNFSFEWADDSTVSLTLMRLNEFFKAK
jgi:hypothetical protein